MIRTESSWSGLPILPNIIAPRVSGLTLSPVVPSSRYAEVSIVMKQPSSGCGRSGPRGRPPRRARTAAGSAAPRTGDRPGERRSPRSMWMSEDTTPSTSTITRSASTIASSTSWVTRRTDGWCAAHSRLSRMCIRIRVSASSAPNGSSASSSSGSRTSERASAARCCSPPDSSCGHAFSRPARPTSASACRPRSRASLPRSPKVTLSSSRRHGSSRESWKTTDTRSGTSIEPVPGDVAVQPGQRPQQRALAAAAAADQGHELARRDLQVEPVEDPAGLAEAAVQLFDPYGGAVRQLPRVRRHASAFLSMRRTAPSAISPSRA